MKQKKYSSKMLPDIDYSHLYHDDLFGYTLTDLEADTKKMLYAFAQKTTELLKDNNAIASIHTMMMNLTAYLSFMTVAGLGQKEATTLKEDLISLITREAKASYKLYETFPLTPTVGEEVQKKNLEKLRDVAPGSIIVQTLRLGRLILDMLDDIMSNAPISVMRRLKFKTDSKEMLPPTLPFMLLLKTTCKNDLRELRKQEKYEDLPIMYYHINHIAVQIGWLVGYYKHLFTEISISEFLQYVTSGVKLYIDHGKFLKISTKKLEDAINNPSPTRENKTPSTAVTSAQTMHVITKDQVKRYERIRVILDRIRATFMMNVSQEAVQRSAKRLEILQGDLTLLLNTEHEMNVFCEYCVFNYKMNGLNLIETAYNKTSHEYKGEELEIFKKAKAASFRFLKLIEPIGLSATFVRKSPIRNYTNKRL